VLPPSIERATPAPDGRAINMPTHKLRCSPLSHTYSALSYSNVSKTELYASLGKLTHLSASSLLNCFQACQGPCLTNVHSWSLANSAVCECRQQQTINDTVDMCTFSKVEDRLHDVDNYKTQLAANHNDYSTCEIKWTFSWQITVDCTDEAYRKESSSEQHCAM